MLLSKFLGMVNQRNCISAETVAYHILAGTQIPTSWSYLLFDSRCLGFPGGSNGKEYTSNVGDMGSIPGLRRSAGRGNGNPLHMFMDEEFL